METFCALQALCAGNSPVTGGFPSQKPVTRSFDIFFDLRQNIRLKKQPIPRWFETALRSLCRRSNVQIKVWEYQAVVQYFNSNFEQHLFFIEANGSQNCMWLHNQLHPFYRLGYTIYLIFWWVLMSYDVPLYDTIPIALTQIQQSVSGIAGEEGKVVIWVKN